MSDAPYTLVAANDANLAIDDAIIPDLQAIEADIAAGRLSQAATALNALQQAHDGDARIYIAGWQLGTASGNFQAALQASERAIALAALWPTTHYCAAQSLRQLSNVPSATIAIENALLLEPTNLLYLEFAITLANSVMDHTAAEKHLRAAFAQKADILGIKTLIGNALRYQAKFDDAESWLNEAVAINPDDAEAHYSLGMIAYERDRVELARTHLADAVRLSPDNEIFLYTHEVVNGRVPATQPEALTRNLFEGYASQFDRHLLGVLKYRVPQLIADKIVEQFPSRNINVLDLGCGTGLLGVALGKVGGHFAGVDLSLAMLKEAEKHNVYARLHHVNLLDALASTAADDYEVVAAADVFTYVGALDVAIRNCFKVLKPGGWLFFSCESAPEEGADFVLSKNMRYAHATAYVKRLLATDGFTTVTIDPIDLRVENDVAVRGYIVSAQKPK